MTARQIPAQERNTADQPWHGLDSHRVTPVR
jgi:hypothetical protein